MERKDRVQAFLLIEILFNFLDLVTLSFINL